MRPQVLIVADNFDAHVKPEVLRLLKANMIDFVGLPPHASHVLQPLDLTLNQSFKCNMYVIKATSEECNNGYLKTITQLASFVRLIAVEQGDRSVFLLCP